MKSWVLLPSLSMVIKEGSGGAPKPSRAWIPSSSKSMSTPPSPPVEERLSPSFIRFGFPTLLTFYQSYRNIPLQIGSLHLQYIFPTLHCSLKDSKIHISYPHWMLVSWCEIQMQIVNPYYIYIHTSFGNPPRLITRINSNAIEPPSPLNVSICKKISTVHTHTHTIHKSFNPILKP